MQNLDVTQIITSLDHTDLDKFAQVIPAELMQEIQAAAMAKETSIDIEILSRFLATFAKSTEMGTNTISEKIMKRDFTDEEAATECKYRRRAWLYIYEINKLRWFLEIKEQLPRQFKEKFLVIDEKAETIRILEEIKAAKAKNKGETQEEGEITEE
jgi:hypothetical protein